MPRGRIESQLSFTDSSYQLTYKPARFYGLLMVTVTGGDGRLSKDMKLAFVALFMPTTGDEYDFHVIDDSTTGLFCAALYT